MNPALRSPIAVTSRIDGSSSTSRIVASTGGSMPAGPSRPGPSAGLRRRAAGGQSEMVASELEEQLAVLGQRPEVVGDERLEFVRHPAEGALGRDHLVDEGARLLLHGPRLVRGMLGVL